MLYGDQTMVRSLLTPDTSQYGKNTVLANTPLIWIRLKQGGTHTHIHTSCTLVQVYVNSVSRLFDVERNSSDTEAAATELLKYNKLERMCKEAVVVAWLAGWLAHVTLRHAPRVTEKNHVNHQSEQLLSGPSFKPGTCSI
jgi:hypothetical protein